MKMFITCHRVLVIGKTEKDGVTVRLRIKNGDAFFTAFMSKKLPPLPASVDEGSQIDISGYVKAAFSEKYGMQYSLTATAVVELNPGNPVPESTTTEPGEPINTEPAKPGKK